jgi:hypothetical protein
MKSCCAGLAKAGMQDKQEAADLEEASQSETEEVDEKTLNRFSTHTMGTLGSLSLLEKSLGTLSRELILSWSKQ